MSNKDDKPKKPVNNFAMLSQKMNEISKKKKPKTFQNQAPESNRDPELPKPLTSKSPANSARSNSPPTIYLEDSMSAGRGESQIEDRDPNVPDRSYGDYFCPLCDSHMNSDAMWIAHISGKRHQKNVEKGSKDPKYDFLDEESCIKEEIKKVKNPVVGLSYVHEIRRKDKGAPPIFTCFLCQANFPTVPLTIEHVLNMKHRLNYLKENDPSEYQLIEATQLKKGHMEPLVEEMATNLEQKYGRGSVKVKQERQKVQPSYTYSSKRPLPGTDDEEESNPRKNFKFDDRDVKNGPRFPKKRGYDSEKDKYAKDIDRRKRNSSSDDEDTNRRHGSPGRNHRDSFSKRYESSTSRDSYHSRNTSPKQSLHTRSLPPREPTRESRRTPYGPDPPNHRTPFGPDPPNHRTSYSPEPLNRRTPYGPEPPPFPSSSATKATASLQNLSSAENQGDAQILQDFMRKIYGLPPEIFFKLVLLKMENIEMKCVEELTLIAKVVQKGQILLCEKLPPELHSIINQKLGQSFKNVAVPSLPSTHQPPSQSSMHQPPSQSSIHQPPSQSSVYQPPSSSLLSRPSQSGDFSFIKEFLDHKGSPSVVAPPMPLTIGQPGVSSVAIPSLSYSGLPSASSSQPRPSSSQAYGSSGQAYQNPGPSARMNMNSYQSNDHLRESYASSSSYQSNSYNNTNNNISNFAAPSNSSGIPGLTLTGENRDRPNYSQGFPPDHSSHYPPSYGY